MFENPDVLLTGKDADAMIPDVETNQFRGKHPLDIRRDGTIDTDQLRELLRSDTILLAVTAVDSELGTIQPLEEIRGILKDYPNCRLHVDATQAEFLIS